MKRFSPEQLQNIVFTVAVVTACAVIGVYLGSRSPDTTAETPAASPTPTVAAEEAAAAGVTADDVTLAFVSYGYAIRGSSAKDADWIIEGVPEIGDVSIACAKKERRIIALTLRVLAQATPTPAPAAAGKGGRAAATPKPSSAIESALASKENAPEASEAYRDALTLLLTAAAGALAGDGAPDEAAVTEWTDGAIKAMSSGEIVHTTGEHTVFTAKRRQGAQQDLLLLTITRNEP